MLSRRLVLLISCAALAPWMSTPSLKAGGPSAKLAPARELIGNWHGAGGDWTMRLKPDGTAIMESGLTSNRGKSIDWRRGTYGIVGGAWTVQVRDVDRKEYAFAVVSHNSDELSLIDLNGKYIEFHRTKEVTLQVIQGKWLGPGSDYTLLLNSDRSAVLEVGVSKGFGQFSEVRAGEFLEHDGFWTLTVKAPDAKGTPGREYIYAIIDHSTTDLSLLDAKGNLLKFHKIL